MNRDVRLPFPTVWFPGTALFPPRNNPTGGVRRSLKACQRRSPFGAFTLALTSSGANYSQQTIHKSINLVITLQKCRQSTGKTHPPVKVFNPQKDKRSFLSAASEALPYRSTTKLFNDCLRRGATSPAARGRGDALQNTNEQYSAVHVGTSWAPFFVGVYTGKLLCCNSNSFSRKKSTISAALALLSLFF